MGQPVVEVLQICVRERLCAGTAMLETALVLPVVLLLLFSVVEFGRVYAEWNTVQSSARAGARAASLFRAQCDAIAVESEVSATVAAVIYSNPLTRGKDPEVTVSNACSTDADRLSCVTVKVLTDFSLLAGLSGFFAAPGGFTLESTSVMRPEAATGAVSDAASCTGA